MKIAIVAGTFFPRVGGAQVQIHNVCNKLVDNNIQTDCYILNKTNIKNNNYKINIFNKFILTLVYFFKFKFRLNINFLLKVYLKKIIAKNRYDFWHFIYLNHKCLILLECLAELDQKILVTFQGEDIQIDKDINYGFRLDKKYEVYLKKTIQKVDHFFYLSHTIKKDLIDLQIPLRKMSYNPNSVEIKKFREHHHLKTDSKKINLITVARYSPKKKGYDILIAIAKDLLKKDIDFEWKIIGKDTDKLLDFEIIKENKNNFKIYENIENINETYFPNSDLIKLYMDSDIYINLSRIESFGITFIESLASLAPIISFDTKGANEIVQDKINGLIVKDNQDLVNKIEKIYMNKDILDKMKIDLVNSIKSYDLDLVIEKYKNLFFKIK